MMKSFLIKKLFTGSTAGLTQTTDVISMRQIPNYIYMVVKPQYNSQKPQFSNHLCFPISGMNITFNNVKWSFNILYSRRFISNEPQKWKHANMVRIQRCCKK